MRFILLLKSNPAAEAGTPPTQAMIEAMMSFYSEMNTAGVVLAAEGLHASSAGARVTFHAPGGSAGVAAPTVVPGPFTPADELVAGFWIIKVKDLEEALEWVKKCPLKEEGATIEISGNSYENDGTSTILPIQNLLNARDSRSEQTIVAMQIAWRRPYLW